MSSSCRSRGCLGAFLQTVYAVQTDSQLFATSMIDTLARWNQVNDDPLWIDVYLLPKVKPTTIHLISDRKQRWHRQNPIPSRRIFFFGIFTWTTDDKSHANKARHKTAEKDQQDLPLIVNVLHCFKLQEEQANKTLMRTFEQRKRLCGVHESCLGRRLSKHLHIFNGFRWVSLR